jgi:hypothetical protein
LNHFSWSDHGYFDVFVCHSAPPSNAVFTCRVADCNDVRSNAHSGNFDGVRVSCVASGYHSYNQVKIVCQKGRVRLMGLGFTKEVDKPVIASSLLHSDNIVGDPQSLSDTRLKRNQAIVPVTDLTSIFNAIETKEYELVKGDDVDGTELPSERRVGFIADDVQVAIAGSDWSNIVGAKMKNGEDYLTLDYSRLVCVLWGVVKGLYARVSTLEATVDALAA